MYQRFRLWRGARCECITLWDNSLISSRRELHFRKIKGCDLNMLLMVFWGSLGLVLGALGGFFGAIFVLLRALGGTLNF